MAYTTPTTTSTDLKLLIKENYQLLIRTIDPHEELLNHLSITDQFSDKIHQVRQQQTADSKNGALLKILIDSIDDHDSVYDKFVDVLREHCQDHVVDILLEKHQGEVHHDRCMSDEHFQILRENMKRLRATVDPKGGIAEELVSDGVFRDADQDRVYSMQTYDEMAMQIIKIVQRKPDTAFQAFVNALENTGQCHVVYILCGVGDIRPLSEKSISLLNDIRQELVENMDPRTTFLNALLKEGAFRLPDKQRVTGKVTDADKNDQILDLMARKSQRAFLGFINALRSTQQEHVADILTGHDVLGDIQTEFEGDISDIELRHFEARLAQRLFDDLVDNNEKAGNNIVHDEFVRCGFSVADVKAGSIVIKFNCRTLQSLRMLKECCNSGKINDLLTETYANVSSSGNNGMLISIILNIDPQSFVNAEQRFDRSKPMTQEHRDFLKLAAETIADTMEVSSEFLKMLSLSRDRTDAILSCTDHFEKIYTLLSIVSKRTNREFYIFVDALKSTGQTEAADFFERCVSPERNTRITELTEINKLKPRVISSGSMSCSSCRNSPFEKDLLTTDETKCALNRRKRQSADQLFVKSDGDELIARELCGSSLSTTSPPKVSLSKDHEILSNLERVDCSPTKNANNECNIEYFMDASSTRWLHRQMTTCRVTENTKVGLDVDIKPESSKSNVGDILNEDDKEITDITTVVFISIVIIFGPLLLPVLARVLTHGHHETIMQKERSYGRYGANISSFHNPIRLTETDMSMKKIVNNLTANTFRSYVNVEQLNALVMQNLHMPENATINIANTHQIPIEESPPKYDFLNKTLTELLSAFKSNLINVIEGTPGVPSIMKSALIEGNTTLFKAILDNNYDLDIDVSSGGLTLLHIAAMLGHADIAKLLIDNDVDVDAKSSSPRGLTALHFAILNGSIEIVEMLLAKQCDINAQYNLAIDRPMTPLHLAIITGKFNIAIKLLENGANADTTHELGRTAWLFAVANGPQDLVKLLLERGADVNASDRDGHTPLHMACNSHNKVSAVEIINHLLTNNANVNTKDKLGRTALRTAVANGAQDLVKLLLEWGADVNAVDANGFTLLHVACALQNHVSAVEIINHLLAKNADVNVRCHTGYTPLQFATLKQNQVAIKLLIDKGAYVNELDDEQLAPLCLAVLANSVEIASLLLNSGATVDTQCLPFNTALCLALSSDNISETIVHLLLQNGPSMSVECSSPPMSVRPLCASLRYSRKLKLLLDHGAFPDTNCSGAYDNEFHRSKPLHMALVSGHLESAALLIAAGADVNAVCCTHNITPLHIAILKTPTSKSTEIMELLLDHGAHANPKSCGKFSLNRATHAVSKYLEIMRLLLQNGADPNGNYHTLGVPLLHYALCNNKIEAIKLLFEYEANVDAPMTMAYNATPLHMAVILERCDAAKILLRNNADTNALTGEYEYTPLIIAAVNGNVEMVKLLLDNGADVNFGRNDGTTALHAATSNNRLEIVELLIDKGADVNRARCDGFTALHFATCLNLTDMVTLLLNAGANVNALDENGTAPIHISFAMEYQEIMNILLRVKGIDVSIPIENCTLLRRAVELGRKGLAKSLLSKSANASEKYSDGLTPMHIAAIKGDVQMIRLLLKYGTHVKINAGCLDDSGHFTTLGTPLFLATCNSHTSAVEFMLKNGADATMSCLNSACISPWVTACQTYLGLLEVLWNEAVNISEPCSDGEMPLHAAVDNYDIDIVRLLLNSKQYASVCSYGVLLLTVWNGDVEIVEMLIEADSDFCVSYWEVFLSLGAALYHGFWNIMQLILSFYIMHICTLTYILATALQISFCQF